MLGKLLKRIFSPSADAALEPASRISFSTSPEQPIPAGAEDHWQHYGGKTVISFTLESRSDGLNAGPNMLAKLFREQGYTFELFDLRREDWRQRLSELLQKPEEICCMIGALGLLDSLQTKGPGAGNLWTESGVPFISIYGDHPAYFFSRHQKRGPGFISLYCFEEHIEAARAWIRPQPTMAKVPMAPWDPVEKAGLDFKAKAAGKICFFKNGNDPRALTGFWKSLPQPMSRWLLELAHSIDIAQVGRNGKPLHIVVADFLVAQGLYTDERPWIELFMVSQLDDYARRVKSTMIAEALLDLPVQVFGDLWDHVDFTGRRATHLPGRSYFDTRQLIAESLSVMDMSPNTQSAPHDRFLAAIGRYTLCLTNRQKYYENGYEGAGGMMFDFDPESIRERVAGVLAHPQQAVDLGVAIAEQGRRLLDPGKVVPAMVEFAHLARFANSPTGFPGQPPFAVWPR